MNKIIDLTYPIEEGMTSFNAYWHPFVEISQIGRHNFEGRETKKICFGTHTGTHIDAPMHFIENGKSIDEYPLDRLMGKVTIIDLSFLDENGEITIDHIKNYRLEEKVIFKLGWGKYWGEKKFYSDYPFFTTEAAEYIMNKGVKLVGLDTPSPDDSRIKLEKELLGSEKDSPIHKIFLSNDILLAEYIGNLDLIDNFDGWNISVMPLKIKGADGSPARICIFK